jgi:hypothetical protein
MPGPSSPPTGIPSNNPAIVYDSKNLWLPRKFVKWDLTPTHNPAVTKGHTYIQVVSNPKRYEIKATTDNFLDTSLAWVEGAGASLFTVAWDSFMAWAMLGKVFEFYRTASDSTAGRSYFQYCVWVGKDDGTSMTVGNPRWSVAIDIATEGAAR